MANNNCNKLDNQKKSAKQRNGAPGGTIVTPIFLANESCFKYTYSMRQMGLLVGYPLLTNTADENKKNVNNLQTKFLGMQFVPELVDGIRNFLTKNPKATDTDICNEFDSIKKRLPQNQLVSNSNHTDPRISKTLQRTLTSVTTRSIPSSVSQFAAAASIHGDNAHLARISTNPALPYSTPLRLRTFNPQDATRLDRETILQSNPDGYQQYLEATEESEIVRVRSLVEKNRGQYFKVNNYLNRINSEIEELRKNNRILPVTSTEKDKNGNVIQGLVLMEVPAGIDLTKVQTLPQDERNKIIERIKNESVPLRNPFDPVRLEQEGITSEDIDAFKAINDNLNELSSSEDYVMASMYSDVLDVKNKTSFTGLNERNIETIRMVQRIRKGEATEEDYQMIKNGGFKESLRQLGSSIRSDQITKKPKDAFGIATSIVQSPTVVGQLTEQIITRPHWPSNQVSKFIRSQLSSNTSISRYNAVKAVTDKLLEPGETFLPELNERWTRGGRQFIRGGRSERVVFSIGENAANKAFHHVFHEGMTRTAAGVNGILYGYELYGNLKDASKGKDVAPEIIKNSALLTTEILVMSGMMGGGVGFFVGLGIYFTYYGYKSAKEETRADEDRNRANALANAAGLVPSMYRYGFVVTNEALISSISKMDQDPNNDIDIVRAGEPENKEITKPYSYVNHFKLFAAEVLTDVGLPGVVNPTEKDTARETITIQRYNLMNNPSSLIVTREGENPRPTNQKDTETQHRCECCGECDSNGNLIVPNDTDYFTDYCKGIFLQYRTLEGIRNGDMLEGYRRLCKIGCFTSDTKVLTPNGEVEISKIKIGDLVIAFDENGNLFESKVTETFKHEKLKINSYVFSNGYTVNSTENHPFYTKNGFVEIGNLNIGDSVIDLDGNETNLVEIIDAGKEDVFNIEVEKYHTYIANKFRVHNKFDPNKWSGGPIEPWPEYEPGLNWPQEPNTPDPYGTYQRTVSYHTTPLCFTYSQPEGVGGGKASPIKPGPRRWVCKWIVVPSYSGHFMPSISEGMFGDDEFGPNIQDLLYSNNGIPLPKKTDRDPVNEPTESSGPPNLVYPAEPSNPTFPFEESNIEIYLSSFPFFLTKTEIEVVKRGKCDEISSYFIKNSSIEEKIKGYHLCLIGKNFTELKLKEDQNRSARTTYIDCLTSNME